MKRYGNLWGRVIAFENLLQANRQAQRGKRFSSNVLAFNYNLEAELHQLQQELTTQTYSPGAYTTFEIQDPKPRLISAAPYRDRVVHHALCNIIVPLIEPTLIHDTYANRVGYGTHKALKTLYLLRPLQPLHPPMRHPQILRLGILILLSKTQLLEFSR